MGLGIAPGLGRVSCAICRANRDVSFSGYVRAGGTLSRRLLLGAEMSGWLSREASVDEYLASLAATFFWYPNARRRLFYKVGVGVMLYQTDDGPNRLTSTAFGPVLGAGYDVPLSATVSLTPFASWHVASLGGELKYNGSTFRDDLSLMLIQVGAGVTWH